MLGRAGRITPGSLREAITQAVMEVAPKKARQRREHAAKRARVERWGEDSGNGALAGRELPPAAVLAADQRITWWARRLQKAGLDGDMDQLRARAYLDLLTGTDSRPGCHDTPAPAPSRPGSPPTSTSPSRWPPRWAWLTGPATWAASARGSMARPRSGPRRRRQPHDEMVHHRH